MLFRKLALIALLTAVIAGPAAADDDIGGGVRINLRDHGARCDGRSDDSLAFMRALQAVGAGEQLSRRSASAR